MPMTLLLVMVFQNLSRDGDRLRTRPDLANPVSLGAVSRKMRRGGLRSLVTGQNNVFKLWNRL
jgi:hypothetical protein